MSLQCHLDQPLWRSSTDGLEMNTDSRILVPAPAVRLMKSRVLSRPGVNSVPPDQRSDGWWLAGGFVLTVQSMLGRLFGLVIGEDGLKDVPRASLNRGNENTTPRSAG